MFSVTQFYWPGSIQNLSNWFTTEEISTKRDAIARLIRDLSTEQNMGIVFPDDGTFIQEVQHKKELLSHLKTQHSVVQIRVRFRCDFDQA